MRHTVKVIQSCTVGAANPSCNPSRTEQRFRNAVKSYLTQRTTLGKRDKAGVEDPSVLQVYYKGICCHILLYHCQIINLITAFQSQFFATFTEQLPSLPFIIQKFAQSQVFRSKSGHMKQ